MNERIKQVAAEVYASFDANERAGVSFGMFPAGKMQAAQAKLLEEAKATEEKRLRPADISRLLAVELMKEANRTPGCGMRA